MPSNHNHVSAQTYSHGVKRTYKRFMRMERAARLALDPAGYTIAEIAQHMGVAPITVSQWTMDPAYHNIVRELQTGVIAEDDRILRQNHDMQREELEAMLPMALMGLRNALFSKNENIKMKAIAEVMDRDGKFAKVSKTSVKLDTSPDLKEVNQIGNELAALLAMGSNSSGFTVTAVESDQMQKNLNQNASKSLEDIDLTGSTPN